MLTRRESAEHRDLQMLDAHDDDAWARRAGIGVSCIDKTFQWYITPFLGKADTASVLWAIDEHELRVRGLGATGRQTQDVRQRPRLAETSCGPVSQLTPRARSPRHLAPLGAGLARTFGSGP